MSTQDTHEQVEFSSRTTVRFVGHDGRCAAHHESGDWVAFDGQGGWPPRIGNTIYGLSHQVSGACRIHNETQAVESEVYVMAWGMVPRGLAFDLPRGAVEAINGPSISLRETPIGATSSTA